VITLILAFALIVESFKHFCKIAGQEVTAFLQLAISEDACEVREHALRNMLKIVKKQSELQVCALCVYSIKNRIYFLNFHHRWNKWLKIKIMVS
jgi:hypothetical protein